MKDPAPFRVGTIAKLVHGIIISSIYDGSLITVLTNETSCIAIHLIKESVFAMFVFLKQRIVISGKTLVEP